MIPINNDGRWTFGKIISSYWILLGVLSVLIVGLVFESSVVSLSGFENIHSSATDIPIFVALGVLSLASQVIILNFVFRKINSFGSFKKSGLPIVFKAMLLTQLVILALLTLILYEVSLTLTYQLFLLKAVFLTSSITATCVMGILSSRFIVWLRLYKNRITLAYLLASSCLSVNAIIGMWYILDQLSYGADIVHPKRFGGFMNHMGVGNLTLANAYVISSAITFTLFWTGTVFLLQSHSKKFGKIKYWIIMSVPLIYFLSQFQPSLLNFVLNYSSTNQTLFSVVYFIMVDASRPVGGVLFGFAFTQIAYKIQNPEVKAYTIISGIGLLLLLVSYQAQDLITAPFPPFGTLSTSFTGLSSYLIFIGIYSSAVSVSQDSQLRDSIRRSVEAEVNFIGNIGNAQMDHAIVEKVLKTSKTVSKVTPEETGVASSLTEKEITEYIKEVLQETQKKKVS
jgi:hypothetical protein